MPEGRLSTITGVDFGADGGMPGVEARLAARGPPTGLVGSCVARSGDAGPVGREDGVERVTDANKCRPVLDVVEGLPEHGWTDIGMGESATWVRYRPAVVDAVRAGRWREAGVTLRAALSPGDGGLRGGIRGGLEFARAAVPSAHRTFRRIRGDESVYAGLLAGGPDTEREREDAPDCGEALSRQLRRSCTHPERAAVLGRSAYRFYANKRTLDMMLYGFRKAIEGW